MQFLKIVQILRNCTFLHQLPEKDLINHKEILKGSTKMNRIKCTYSTLNKNVYRLYFAIFPKENRIL